MTIRTVKPVEDVKVGDIVFCDDGEHDIADAPQLEVAEVEIRDGSIRLGFNEDDYSDIPKGSMIYTKNTTMRVSVLPRRQKSA